MRIVSFLAAGTEIVNAIGAGDNLLGRSHECDYPPGVERLPIVSRPALELAGVSQAEIDSAVAGHMNTGESLYVVDESCCGARARRDPDAGAVSRVRAVRQRVDARAHDVAQEAGAGVSHAAYARRDR